MILKLEYTGEANRRVLVSMHIPEPQGKLGGITYKDKPTKPME